MSATQPAVKVGDIRWNFALSTKFLRKPIPGGAYRVVVTQATKAGDKIKIAPDPDSSQAERDRMPTSIRIRSAEAKGYRGDFESPAWGYATKAEAERAYAEALTKKIDRLREEVADAESELAVLMFSRDTEEPAA